MPRFSVYILFKLAIINSGKENVMHTCSYTNEVFYDCNKQGRRTDSGSDCVCLNQSGSSDTNNALTNNTSLSRRLSSSKCHHSSGSDTAGSNTNKKQAVAKSSSFCGKFLL